MTRSCQDSEFRSIEAGIRARYPDDECGRCEYMGSDPIGENLFCKRRSTWTNLYGSGECLEWLDDFMRERNAALDAYMRGYDQMEMRL